MDLFAKIEKNEGPLGQYRKAAHGYFMFPKLEGEIGPHMVFRGKMMLNWSLNNYLGLANLPEVREADAEGAKKWGLAAPMGARMMSGQTSLHEKLEQELAIIRKKLDNPNFVGNAKPEVVAKEEEKLSDVSTKISLTKELLQDLSI